jgi:hypothetical protein
VAKSLVSSVLSIVEGIRENSWRKTTVSTFVESALQKNFFLQNKAKLTRFGQSGQLPHPSFIPKITSKQCKSAFTCALCISVKKLSVKSAQSASMIPKVFSLASGVRCLVSELIRVHSWLIKEKFLCKTNPISPILVSKITIYPKNEPNSKPNEANFLASLLTIFDLFQRWIITSKNKFPVNPVAVIPNTGY